MPYTVVYDSARRSAAPRHACDLPEDATGLFATMSVGSVVRWHHFDARRAIRKSLPDNNPIGA